MLTPADSADADAILGVAHNELRLTDPNAQHPNHRIKVSEIRTGRLAAVIAILLLPAFAQIVPNRTALILPPVEYDHQYDGDLTIKIVDTFEELYALCGTRNPYMLACSYPGYADHRSCIIIMVNDEKMRKQGWTTGLLFRHEQGHCNGWPGDHIGQRPLTDSTHWLPPAERIKIPNDRLEQAEKARAAAPQ
jgi:hypothetical protein